MDYPIFNEPTHMIFNQSVNADWALNECQWIVNNLIPSDYADASILANKYVCVCNLLLY